jgi:hypothetical protein
MNYTQEKPAGQDLLQRIDTRALPVTCKKCHHDNDEPVLSAAGQHVRADCVLCGSFIKFMPLAVEFASSGFYSRIYSWLPKFSDRDLHYLVHLIDKVRAGNRVGTIGKGYMKHIVQWLPRMTESDLCCLQDDIVRLRTNRGHADV